MKKTHSREILKPRYKSRSVTYSQSKEPRQHKDTKDNKRLIKAKPKDRPDTTICKMREGRDERLKGIMTSTLDLLRSSTSIDGSKSTKKPPKDLIGMAQSIHTLVSCMMKKEEQRGAVKKSDSFVTERERSINRQSLIKYLQSKFGYEMKDSEIEKRLRSMQVLKRSLSRHHQSQSIECSDFDKENYESLNEKRLYNNCVAARK